MTTSGVYNQFPGQVLEGGLATALTSAQLSDSAKRWRPNQWQGHLVRLRGGNNDGWTTPIASNDALTLRFADRTPNLPETTVETSYEILTAVGASDREDGLERLGDSMEAMLGEMHRIRELLELAFG